MNDKEFEKLNGEQLLHTVWVERNGQVIGLSDQTISDISKKLECENVVKITCQGFTLEHKVREVARWGD